MFMVRRRPAPHPVLLVLTGVVSVQTGAAVAKQLFPVLGPAGTVFLRLAVGALVLGPVAVGVIRAARRGALRLAVLFGLVLAAMNLCFYLSLTRVPLGIAVTVEFLGPLAVAVAGSRRPRDLVWAALAAVGVVVLTGGGQALASGRLDALGLALALLTGVFWAGYIVLSQRVGSALPGVSGLGVALVVAAVVVAPVGIAQAGTRLLEPHLLLLGVAVGLLSSAVPYALEMAALRRLGAGTFGVLMSLEPAVASVVGVAVLREHLGIGEVVGVVLVCLASAGATRAPVTAPEA